MKNGPRNLFLLAVIIGYAISLPTTLAMERVDHGGYALLLERHVRDGMVDYKGFKRDERLLDRYLADLGNVTPDRLSRDDQFAFYINVYNAWTIKLILSGYPGIRSIKDLGSFLQSPWKKKIVRLKAVTVTLDHIEHDILRPVFRDPRVHFAINCAARSCPPLLSVPFYGNTLNEQLDTAATAFINDVESNYIRGNTLYASRIFKWFKTDFDDDIIGFFLTYAQGKMKHELENKQNILEVKYLGYDWSLNGK
jgi:hypothetical protein